MWEHVSNVMVSQQENVVRILDPVPEPYRRPSGIAHIIAEIIEVVAQKHHTIMALRRNPVIGDRERGKNTN